MVKGFLKSFVYAFNGMYVALRDQRNLKIQAFIAFLTVGIGIYFHITVDEWCMILLCIAIVMGMEMVNTGMESLVDLVTQERKPLAGKVKDIAAGAVLFASVIASIIGLLVFWKYVF